MEDKDIFVFGVGIVAGVLGYDYLKNRNPKYSFSILNPTRTPTPTQDEIPNLDVPPSKPLPIYQIRQEIVRFLVTQKDITDEPYIAETINNISDESYLRGWHSAIMRGESTFTLNYPDESIAYNTIDGTIVGRIHSPEVNQGGQANMNPNALLIGKQVAIQPLENNFGSEFQIAFLNVEPNVDSNKIKVSAESIFTVTNVLQDWVFLESNMGFAEGWVLGSNVYQIQ